MENIKLGPRLQALADYVPPADRVVDIGCDHGYLPVWLLKMGLVRRAVAADIHEKPLQKAVDCAEAHGLTEEIDFVLTDGLQGIAVENGDAVVIAGMGGETIAAILAGAPALLSLNIKLILQPMSKIQVLLRWLYENGFHVEDECLAEEAGEIYRVFSVSIGREAVPDRVRLLVGDRLFEKQDPLLPRYLERLCARIARARDGMLKSAEESGKRQAAELTALLVQLEKKREAARYG